MAITLTGVNHPHYGYITITSSCDEEYPTVTRLILKRKIQSDILFTSLYTKQVATESDLTFGYTDFLCRNNVTYQYKVVYLNDEDSVVAEEYLNIKSHFDVLVIADIDASWVTPLNCSAINTTRIKPYATNSPIYSRKPSTYSVSAINYEEGTCTGIFLEMTGEEDNITFETDNNWRYRKRFKDFITQGNAKILKGTSGDAWMVSIKTDSIADMSLFDKAEIDGARQIEFGWIEVGDLESESNLYDNSFISVPPEYWSSGE